MTKTAHTLIEEIITHQVAKKAEELGITFKIKHSRKDGVNDILLRMKRENHLHDDSYKELVKKQHTFADFVSTIVLGQYANHIRFSYPSNL